MTAPTEISAEIIAARHPDGPLIRVSEPVRFWHGFIPAVKEIWSYHELLVNLVRRELKVKYKDSVLGFLWSLLRPMFLLLVYYLAIGVFLGTKVKLFPVFLFSGLVAWNLFTDVVGGCTTSITGNGSLIKKIYFPRELMPLAVVGAAMVNFAMQLIVLAVAEIGFGLKIGGHEPWLLPLAFIVLLGFMTAIGLFLSAANVYLRDVEHLIEVVLLLWFWMTPIVYAVGGVLNRLGHSSYPFLANIYMLNPMTSIVSAFQRGVYGQTYVNGLPQMFAGQLLGRLLIILVLDGVLIFLAQRFFARAQGNFAQEL